MRLTTIAAALGLGIVVVPAAAQFATFTGGSLFLSGSSSDPFGNSDSASAPGVVGDDFAFADGSTDSGLVGASYQLDGQIVDGGDQVIITFQGAGQASQPAGYGGQASLTLTTGNPSTGDDPIILTIGTEADEYAYSIEDLSTGLANVGLTAVTGTLLPGGFLTPGDYAIDIFSSVFVSEPDTLNEASIGWTLTITVPTPGAAAIAAMAGLALLTRRR